MRRGLTQYGSYRLRLGVWKRRNEFPDEKGIDTNGLERVSLAVAA